MKSFYISEDVQKLSDSFCLAIDKYGEKILLSEKLGIVMHIKHNGYIPKSGLLIAEQLEIMKIHGKALDIGTGETGILANCLLAHGASKVVASDIDPIAIQWAKQASNRSREIVWHNCDLFPFSQTEKDGTFDIIVSNPPQMPMPYHGHLHDYGGSDGRSCIIRIIERGKQMLRRNGKLVLLCFDFLSVDCSYGHETIIELAKRKGLKTSVTAKHKRIIQKGGKTEENIDWIERIFHGYIFQKDSRGNYYHEILILEMSHDLI